MLGSLATTQREYVALHAFGQLNPQVGNLSSNKSFIDAFSYSDAVKFLLYPSDAKCNSQTQPRAVS